MLGLLLIDKPIGWTSHDVVGKLRRVLGTRRIGHAGTLDPLATGLLVVAVGPATRFLQYLPLEPKEYVGTFKFGEETDTYDAEGEVVEAATVPADLWDRVSASLGQFRGEIEQLPPLYSAVKQDGKPLYRYARSGQEVERRPRRVTVHEFEAIQADWPDVDVRIVCSGGTYVRSLAHDLGKVVGCGAHVAALRRTGVGAFRLEGACHPESASPDRLIPLATALASLPSLPLDATAAGAVRNGRAVASALFEEGAMVALIDHRGEIIGVGRAHGNEVRPECVLPIEATSGTV